MSLVSINTVKTKTKIEKVGIIKSQDFFKHLHEHGIVKSDSVYRNLTDFLCIDQAYPNSLMFLKMKRALSDFASFQDLKAAGLKKRQLPIEYLNPDYLKQRKTNESNEQTKN